MAVGMCFFGSLVLLANEPSSDGEKKTAQTTADVVAFAQDIDQLVADELKKRSQPPRPKIDDYTFCRRIYLDAIGRIPTIIELEEFVGDDDPGKRSRLN